MSNIVRLSFLTFLYILGIVQLVICTTSRFGEITIQPTQEAYSSDSPVIVEVHPQQPVTQCLTGAQVEHAHRRGFQRHISGDQG